MFNYFLNFILPFKFLVKLLLIIRVVTFMLHSLLVSLLEDSYYQVPIYVKLGLRKYY